MSRPWIFDMDILCPTCGGHRLKYSDPTCPRSRETLNEKYFIILKFMELEHKIKELEKLNKDEKEEKQTTGNNVERKKSDDGV